MSYNHNVDTERSVPCHNIILYACAMMNDDCIDGHTSGMRCLYFSNAYHDVHDIGKSWDTSSHRMNQCRQFPPDLMYSNTVPAICNLKRINFLVEKLS